MKNMDLQIFAEPNVPSNPITPEINYETEAFINTSPAEGQPTWASLANLTTNMAQSLNEVIQQLTYYADKGWGSSEVTGAQLTLTLTGSVKSGDDACDYILSDILKWKSAHRLRRVQFRCWILNGTEITSTLRSCRRIRLI